MFLLTGELRMDGSMKLPIFCVALTYAGLAESVDYINQNIDTPGVFPYCGYVTSGICIAADDFIFTSDTCLGSITIWMAQMNSGSYPTFIISLRHWAFGEPPGALEWADTLAAAWTSTGWVTMYGAYPVKRADMFFDPPYNSTGHHWLCVQTLSSAFGWTYTQNPPGGWGTDPLSYPYTYNGSTWTLQPGSGMYVIVSNYTTPTSRDTWGSIKSVF
jgi:hypothetical protein